MKKARIISIILIACLLIIPNIIYSSTKLSSNLLDNTGFETGSPANWTTTGGPASFMYSTTAHQGTHAVSIQSLSDSGTEGGWINSNRWGGDSYIPVKEGKSFAVSAWVKGNGLTGGMEGDIWIRWYSTANESGFINSSSDIGNLTDTFDYKYVTGTVTAPTNARYARVVLGFHGKTLNGQVYYDDVTMYDIEGGTNYLYNADFNNLPPCDWITFGGPAYCFTSDKAYTGAHSVAITCLDGGGSYGGWINNARTPDPSCFIPVDASKTYNLSAYISGNAINNGVAAMWVSWYSDESESTYIGLSNFVGNLSGTFDYTFSGSDVTPPSNAKYARIVLGYYGNSPGATIWYDNAKFVESGKTINLITNGDFEIGYGWEKVGESASYFRSDICRSGPGAAGIKSLNDSGNWAGWLSTAGFLNTSSYIPVDVNKSYVVSGWVKGDQLNNGMTADMWVRWYSSANENALIENSQNIGGLTGTFDYSYISGIVTPPTGAAYARVVCGFHGKSLNGTVLYDDVSFGESTSLTVKDVNATINGTTAVLENTYYTYTLGLGSPFTIQMYNNYLGRNIISNPNTAKVFTVNYNGVDYDISNFIVNNYSIQTVGSNFTPNGKQLVIGLVDNIPNINLSATLKITVDDSSEASWDFKINNTGSSQLTGVKISFPVLDGINLSDTPSDNYYFYPYYGGIISNSDTINPDRNSFDESGYGKGIIIPLMDMYTNNGGGLYVLVKDTDAVYKNLALRKTGANFWTTVDYYSRPLPAGYEWSLPTAAIGCHHSDWREGIYKYRLWAYSTFYDPTEHNRSAFTDNFTLNFALFKYTWPEYASQALDNETNYLRLPEWINEGESLGYGGWDILHLPPSAWCYDLSKAQGFGDYYYDGMGGLPYLQLQISQANSLGKSVGLWMSSTLTSEFTDIGSTHGEEWEAYNINGQPYRYWATASETVYNECLGYRPWQDYLRDTFTRVVGDLNVNVYLDELGIAGNIHCYRSAHNHDHPDVATEGCLDMLQKIRAGINSARPSSALFSESIGPDIYIGYKDGSFLNWVVASHNSNLVKLSPSQVNLVRFIFPEYKIYEIPCWGENWSQLRQAFFNGNGIYLQQGNKDCPVYSDQGKALVNKMHSLFMNNIDIFKSSCPVALSETGGSDVYANMFPTTSKVGFTVYNAGTKTATAKIYVPAAYANKTFTNQWNGGTSLTVYTEGEKKYVSFQMEPRSVSFVVGE